MATFGAEELECDLGIQRADVMLQFHLYSVPTTFPTTDIGSLLLKLCTSPMTIVSSSPVNAALKLPSSFHVRTTYTA